MKKYNVNNYSLYNQDLKANINKIPKDQDYQELTRDQLIIMFLPLVENIAKKFPTGVQSSGILDITDLIQEGSIGLIAAVDRIEWDMINISSNKENTLRSFLTKRIRGAIRRAIDINRAGMRIPEHKLNEIKKNFDKDEKMVAMFFNSMFLSIDDYSVNDQDPMNYNISNWTNIEDKSVSYNVDLLNVYLIGLLKKHLTEKEYEVLRLSYGMDCEKHSAQEIANKLGLQGSSAYVRVSQLKRQAVDKLIKNVDYKQVLDYL